MILMDGRVWHTSGNNVTEDQDRALIFSYYSAPYIRPQWNFTASLRAGMHRAHQGGALLPDVARHHPDQPAADPVLLS